MTCSSAHTTISALSMESGDASGGLSIRNLQVQLEVEKHRCVLTKHKQEAKRKRKNQRTNSDVEKNANRTGRCSCMDYKRFKNGKETRSRTYCAACPIPKGAKQCWLCVEYKDDHRGRIRDALMST